MGKQPKFIKKHLADALEQKVKSKSNPFDKFANKRQKHVVLNRKVKGEDRDVGRARAKAIDERKKKLLKDYHAQKRSNTIIDKRLSEYDPNISMEEKMFLRLQKEKMQKLSKNMSKYNLDNEDNAVLTHKGEVLGQSNIQDNDFVSSDEEDSGKLHKDIVNRLHFGGGLPLDTNTQNLIKDSGDKIETLQRKGRLEALQEIVMKSKLHKQQRKEQKEEQEQQREQLDAEFDSLLNELEFNEENSGKSLPRRGNTTSQGRERGEQEGQRERRREEVDEYDLSLQEMMYEKKAAPSDRSKTEGEVAREKREEMEEQERERLLRMTAIAQDREKKERDGTFHSVYREVGGARRGVGVGGKRVRNDDELDDWDEGHERGGEGEEEEEESEEEGGDGEEEEDFLLEDWGEGEGEDDEEEGDEEVEEGEEEESEGEGEEEEEDDEEEGYWQEEEADEEEEEEEKEEESLPLSQKKVSFSPSLPPVSPPLSETMPHTLPVPLHLKDFLQMVERYCQAPLSSPAPSPPSVSLPLVEEMVRRVVAYSSPLLPGAEGRENAKKMTHFTSLLCLYFTSSLSSLSSSTSSSSSSSSTPGAFSTLPLPPSFPPLSEEHADFLSSTLYSLFSSLPRSKTLLLSCKLFSSLFSSLSKHTSFPPRGETLLLSLLGRVFSLSDLKHDVGDNLKLCLSLLLSQRRVEGIEGVEQTLLLSSLLLDFTRESRKVVPEVVSALSHLLYAFSPSYSALSSTLSSSPFFSPLLLSPSLPPLLRGALSSLPAPDPTAPLPKVSLLKSSAEARERSVPSLFLTLLSLVEEVTQRHAGERGSREGGESLFSALSLLRPQDSPSLSPFYQQRVLSLLETLHTEREKIRSEREALAYRPPRKVVIESKQPRYEVGYVPRKDNTTDRERGKLKQLERELKREKKAAMRELRRDSAFLAEEREREQRQEEEQRRGERRRNFAWLEEQQASLNLQVRTGKGLAELKGGGTGHLKKKNRR